MGVRGLTTYIAENADRYLDSFELHDCTIVIDGDSLSCQLYKSVDSAFGGNYDHFHRIVCNFFNMLKQCNVTSYVLLDGGYQQKKLGTVRQRLRSKIGAIKHLNPLDCLPMFPQLMREVFVEALEQCGVRFMRCIFEADDEVAALSRKLKCPVLSFDSDFYIHNVIYIPSVSLSMKVFRRNIPDDSKQKIRLRKDTVSELDSNGDMHNFKSNKVLRDQQSDVKKSYYYMECLAYRIANLTREIGLRAEMLPLFAILLGNDYISTSIFSKFFMNVSLKETGKNNTRQGKRIIALLKWLQRETLNSAIDKIINHVEKEKKEWLREQIRIGISGYVHEKSMAYEYFGLSKENSFAKCSIEHIPFESIPNEDDAETQLQEEEEQTGSLSSSQNIIIPTFKPPSWLLRKILSGRLPRYIVDLMTMRLYINSPQVENFQLPDCNQISIPILQLIFTILHMQSSHNANLEFRYLTRIQRRCDIEYKRFGALNITFTEDAAGHIWFKNVLNGFENANEICNAIDSAPSDLRLLFIAVIYWSRYSKHFNVVYASSILLCYIQLALIDAHLVPPVRSQAQFEKKFNSKYMKNLSNCNNTKEDGTPKCIDAILGDVTRDECILAQSNLLYLFLPSEKLRTKHTEFYSDIIHGFAEIQSIVHQLNSLNVLCSEPYANIQTSKTINGGFLFNTYLTLKDRPNINYYIKQFIFPRSPNLYSLFETMMGFLATFIGHLSKETISKKKKKRNLNKKRSRENKQKMEEINETVHETDVQSNCESESDFEDLNNKFSCLLRK